MVLTFGSLFSGIGGFDLGFKRAGMECAWQVEIDKKCQDVLRKHFPDTEIYSDVRQCGAHNLQPVDVICGGFPCQDLSVAGRRAGLAGERSGLWYEFHRILAEVRPGWVVIENVPGLLSSNGGRDFAIILRGLAELGYGIAWRILDAQYFGVAQRRRRVFIVGHLGDGRAAQVLFERESSSGDTPPSREAGKGIAPTLSGSANRTGGDRPPGTQVETAESLVVNAFNGYTGRADDNDAQGNHIVAMPHIAGAMGVRRLTPVECERLQGFPDGWTDGQADSTRYRQLGNAVAVPVIEWIGKRIREVNK